MEHQLRCRSVAGWHTLPGIDDPPCVDAGKCSHRSRPESERRRWGARIEPSQTATWRVEVLVL
jgi:hypothetical protein